MKRETIKISEDRNLYNYTFEIEDEAGEGKKDGEEKKDKKEKGEEE